MKRRAEPTVEELFSVYREQGDVRALGEVFDRTAEELMRLAAHLAPDRAAAEDLVQNTFLSAIERGDRYERERPLMPWLLGVLANHARRERSARSRRPERSLLPESPVLDPAREAEERELKSALVAALEDTRDPYRQVLELHLCHGLEPASIARVLRRPQGTVRSQLSRGLDGLRRALPKGYATAGSTILAAGWLASPSAAAVRRVILDAAHRGAAATTVAGATAGFMAMKKAAFLAVTVAIVAFAAFLSLEFPWPGDPRAPDREASASTDASAPVAGNLDPPAATSDTPLERSEVIPSPAPEPVPEALELPDTGAVRVVVTWKDDGEPAVGIGLRVRPIRGSLDAFHARHVKTDRRGVALADGLAAGMYSIETLDCGASTGAQVVPPHEIDCRMTIERGVVVEGIVVDETGVPIADAGVWASISVIQFEGVIAVRTGDDGRFRLVGMGKSQTLSAQKAGFGPAPMTRVGDLPSSSPGVHTARLVLSLRGAAVEGIVVDAMDRPVEGAAVQMRVTDPSAYQDASTGYYRPPPARRCVTDAEGRFRAVGLAAGATLISVRSDGLSPAELEQVLEPHMTHSVRVVLQTGVTVHGRATDENGEPIEFATIQTGEHDVFKLFSDLTQADGRYELEGIPAGRFRIEASTNDGRRDAGTLEAMDGAEIEWNPVLRPPTTLEIRGRLVDSAHNPLRQWGIKARGRLLSPQTATGANGEFELTGLGDETYSIEVREPREWLLPPIHVVEGVSPTSGSELLIVVPKAATAKCGIVGRLLDTAGRPAADANILLWSDRTWQPMPVQLDPTTGEFRRSGLPGGEYRLTFTLAGVPPWSKTCTLTPGETLDLGNVQAESPGRVVVTASLPDNAALLRARCVLVPAAEAQEQAVATLTRNMAMSAMSGTAYWMTPSGARFLAQVPPGPYRLRLWGDNFAPYECDLPVASGEETAQSVDLSPAASRTFQFDIADDTTWPIRLDLRVVGPEGVVYEAALQSLQRQPYGFRAGFAPGQYVAHAETNTGLSGRAEFQVEGTGQGDPVRIQLR